MPHRLGVLSKKEQLTAESTGAHSFGPGAARVMKAIHVRPVGPMRIEVSNGGSRSQQSAPSAAESAKIIEARPASTTHAPESWIIAVTSTSTGSYQEREFD